MIGTFKSHNDYHYQYYDDKDNDGNRLSLFTYKSLSVFPYVQTQTLLEY